MNTDRKKTWFRLFLCLASVVFTLSLTELGLRYFRPVNYRRPPEGPPWNKLLHQPSSIPGLAYEMAPNMEKVWDGVIIKTNSYGMRDHEPVPQKTDSLRRVVVFGDSYTFGLGVPAEQTYPKVLEKLLNQSTVSTNYQYEVLTFAVIGYSTQDEALLLKHKALAWDPDVVIIGYVLNDPEIEPIDNLHSYFDKPRWWQYSHLLRLVARVKHNREMKTLGGGDYYRYLHAEGQEKWMSVVRAFREIQDVTSRRGITVLVVIFPVAPLTQWAGYPYQGIHKQVADLARKNGFQAIDLYEVYSHYEPRDLRISPYDEHPTRLGHDLAARAIREKLLAERSFFFGDKKGQSSR